MRFEMPAAPPKLPDPAQPDIEPANRQVNQAMKALYDHYFASLDYGKRYPQPNQATFEFLLHQGASQAQEILDFGCGNGRYALALLQATQATLTGYDISDTALAEFSRHLEHAHGRARVKLQLGTPGVWELSGRYDLVLMLFGVLSHVGGFQERVQTLRQIRDVMDADGRLLLTVPNLWRRRPLELTQAVLMRWIGRAEGLQAEPGNIVFCRKLAGVPHQFFYHLYTVESLRNELREAGFEVTRVEAESILPEWLITQHPWLGRIDARLSRLLPASWGYGIRAVASPL
ncbi:MAG: hypothetical protein FD135_2720 [Comamonadaceae bacterium]|nr:MAG: hypothetical protein FD135_2720 [Comamonadaceae bacterium]